MNIISDMLSFSEGATYMDNHLFSALPCEMCGGVVSLAIAYASKFTIQISMFSVC